MERSSRRATTLLKEAAPPLALGAVIGFALIGIHKWVTSSRSGGLNVRHADPGQRWAGIVVARVQPSASDSQQTVIVMDGRPVSIEELIVQIKASGRDDASVLITLPSALARAGAAGWDAAIKRVGGEAERIAAFLKSAGIKAYVGIGPPLEMPAPKW